MKTAIAHCTLYTGRDYYQDGLVLIENGAITYAGAAIPFSADEVINARGGICMPGLVNAHTHIAMSLMRGVGAGLPLMDWLQVIFPIEDRLTDERVYWGSMLSIMEMI
ncbi:MAG TPA: amidohydrolase family protein, partial [Candidatus Alectryocaccomicrobium excrementavium]|nr:amidohydrolase family protein [Candidatus Alectryocaccomicrobium excrementavium]